MDILTAKQIRIEDYLHSLGHTPVRRQGANLWYRSPLRQEKEASFKVNTGINCWYDFGLGKGGNLLALAAGLHPSSDISGLLRQIAERNPPRASGIRICRETAFGRTRFPPPGDTSAYLTRPACLFVGTGYRCGNRPEGMPGNPLRVPGQTVLCRRLSEHCRRF